MGGRGRLWKVEVGTAGGGLKDERQKKRGGRREGGRSWQHTVRPPYTFLIPKPPAWSLPIKVFLHVHNTLYISHHSTAAHASESASYHPYLSALSLSKPTRNPSNIPAINLTLITPPLSGAQSYPHGQGER